MPATRHTLALDRRIRDQVDAVLDAQARDLVRAWVDAWDEVAPDLNATLVEMLLGGDRVTRTQLIRSTRLRRALAVVAAELRALADEAGVRITGDLEAVIDRAGAAQASVVDSQLPPGTGLVDAEAWGRVDARQLEAIVARSTEQILSRLRPVPDDVYELLRRELIRGVAAGSNPRATARRIVARAEGRFNGGLTRALNVARTETLDAHRAAAAAGQALHADVLAGWAWSATLDVRTCPSCIAQHGRVHPLAEPGPLDHQQGRCARLGVTKSWAELGFTDVDEPASLLPDADAWFQGLSASEQKQLLGPTRHAAWVAGDFPMDAWSVRHETAGWRDSYRLAPVPRSSSPGRRAA